MNCRKLPLLSLTTFLATGLFVVAAPPLPDTSVAALQSLSDTFASVAQRIKPCVVTVYSEKTIKMPGMQGPFGDQFPFRWFFGDQNQPPLQPPHHEYKFKQSGMGSGVIIDKEGRVLTNNHVVGDMDEIKIKLPGGATYDATVVGTDPGTDLAVIKIKGDVPKDLPVASLGDSDAMRVGDWVLAVGAPFGYEQTVTAGIISAKGRTGVEREDGKYEDFLQTDAAINPGNSGGPLVNLQGQVIGINTAIATSVGQFAGVGFAIPINMAKPIIHELIATGKVTRGLLGIIIQPVNADLAKHFGLTSTKGALVSQVNPASAADKAGIKVGDVILRYAGQAVTDTADLRNRVAATLPGTQVDIVVLRDGKERTVTAKIGELTPEAQASNGGEEEPRTVAQLGLAVEPLTPDKAKQLGYGDDKGVLISNVDDGGPAADAGLQPGDLVTEVNRAAVSSVHEFDQAVAAAKNKDSILMLVKSHGISRFVILKLK